MSDTEFYDNVGGVQGEPKYLGDGLWVNPDGSTYDDKPYKKFEQSEHLIMIRWGKKLDDGTERDYESLVGTIDAARNLHGQLLADEQTTYLSMERFEDEHISNIVE